MRDVPTPCVDQTTQVHTLRSIDEQISVISTYTCLVLNSRPRNSEFRAHATLTRQCQRTELSGMSSVRQLEVRDTEDDRFDS